MAYCSSSMRTSASSISLRGRLFLSGASMYRQPMKAQNEVTISFRDFVKATSVVDRRRKHLDRKKRGVPKTTLIYAEKDKLVVYTPFLRSELPFAGLWSVSVEVHAIRFSRLVKQLPRSKTARLTYVAGSLILGDGLYIVPASPCESPTS